MLFYPTGAEGNPAHGCILRFRGTRWIGEDWSAQTEGGKLPRIDGTGAIDQGCTEGSSGYKPAAGEFGEARFGTDEYPHDDPPMDGLSTGPAELATALMESSASGGSSPVPAVTPGPGQALETGGWVRVLEQSIFEAPPALQPGFYWFGRQIPGMEANDSDVDPVGREAISLHIATEGGDRTWYVDPEHLQVMAYVVVEIGSGSF